MYKSKLKRACEMALLDDLLSFYKCFDIHLFNEEIENIKIYLSNSNIDVEDKECYESILKKYT